MSHSLKSQFATSIIRRPHNRVVVRLTKTKTGPVMEPVFHFTIFKSYERAKRARARERCRLSTGAPLAGEPSRFATNWLCAMARSACAAARYVWLATSLLTPTT